MPSFFQSPTDDHLNNQNTQFSNSLPSYYRLQYIAPVSHERVFFFIFRFCRAIQNTLPNLGRKSWCHTLTIYTARSLVYFKIHHCVLLVKKESFNTLCSFSITPRIYPLGFTFRKTKFSRKITSMIYTSNCILSKVVSETSVAAISACHLSPAGVFSFVSLFFSFQWRSNGRRRGTRRLTVRATSLPVTRAGFVTRLVTISGPALVTGWRRRLARVRSMAAPLYRAGWFVWARTRSREKKSPISRV